MLQREIIYKHNYCNYLVGGLTFFPPTCQIADVQVEVSQNTEALQGAQMERGDLSRQIQTLEIELASQQSLVSMHCIFNPQA